MTRFIGGPLDGKQTDATAPVLIQPVVTPEWVNEQREWHDRYGVAWAALYWDHIPRDPVLPREPRMPRATYHRRPDGYLFEGIS